MRMPENEHVLGLVWPIPEHHSCQERALKSSVAHCRFCQLWGEVVGLLLHTSLSSDFLLSFLSSAHFYVPFIFY